MSEVKNIIFDCDGVLVDTERIMISSLLEMAAPFGANMDEEEAVEQFSGRRILEVIQILEQKAATTFPLDFEKHFRARAYERFQEEVEAVPGITELLNELDRPYCVASSGPREKILLNLKLTGLKPYFPDQHIFSSYDHDIQSWKPDPGIFLHAAQKMGFDPTSTVVVEDSLAGVEAAVRGGFRVYAYANVRNDQALQALGATVFDSMYHLPILLGL